MRNDRMTLAGWSWVVAVTAGFGVLVGLVLPWYRGSVTGNADFVEIGLVTAEGACVAAAVVAAIAIGIVSWLRQKQPPGLLLTVVALVLAGIAFGVAWLYGEQNADPVIVAGRRLEAGLGGGFYFSLVLCGVMVLALAGGVVICLMQRQSTQKSRSTARS